MEKEKGEARNEKVAVDNHFNNPINIYYHIIKVQSMR